jgi:hypothetical protein
MILWICMLPSTGVYVHQSYRKWIRVFFWYHIFSMSTIELLFFLGQFWIHVLNLGLEVGLELRTFALQCWSQQTILNREWVRMQIDILYLKWIARWISHMTSKYSIYLLLLNTSLLSKRVYKRPLPFHPLRLYHPNANSTIMKHPII